MAREGILSISKVDIAQIEASLILRFCIAKERGGAAVAIYPMMAPDRFFTFVVTAPCLRRCYSLGM